MYKPIIFGWLASVFLTFITGPLGSFIIWRRMSSFGDTLSHSSLLGISCAIFLNVHPFYTVFVIILCFIIFINWIENHSSLSLDTILGIIGCSSLSLGMIIMSIISNDQKTRFANYLFGNLLEVTYDDLVFIFFSCIAISIVLLRYWNKILLITVNADLAKVDGVDVCKVNFVLFFLVSLTISIAIKFLGTLIIISLLLIPSATAQKFSNSPERMAVISTLIGIVSLTGGIVFSMLFNLPISPSIVLFATFIFLASNILK
ncbi:high-affinity zinc transporter membrane component [Buchnera aphidicola (Schlechtendalia chinensis)]|uniref:High-affinity zinc uptake system membrane protein ZnuB n=1 Tax=Buchnera aphidicola subsp. Schlechtendalia chinensis TaxID=118110 RepID=A0A172WDL8_BUCSC|nr:iron chelate uptake ABC transporter family permease subunit [Buchnera aphidicola]ANF17073.1 high-affinity zinc transporter membrane component [Buchnera aphidicola (Schlechtendalia chinensis)]